MNVFGNPELGNASISNINTFIMKVICISTCFSINKNILDPHVFLLNFFFQSLKEIPNCYNKK